MQDQHFRILWTTEMVKSLSRFLKNKFNLYKSTSGMLTLLKRREEWIFDGWSSPKTLVFKTQAIKILMCFMQFKHF